MNHHPRPFGTACAFVILTSTALLAFASGCSTYVNIPNQVGDVASNNPDRGNVVDAQAAALRAIISSTSFAPPVTIRLAPGTSPDAYARALPTIDDSVVKHEGGGQANLDVQRVLIRGWVAQTDVVRAAGSAAGESSSQLVTAYLRWRPFSGWYVDRLKTWRIPVAEALLQSRRDANVSITPEN